MLRRLAKKAITHAANIVECAWGARDCFRGRDEKYRQRQEAFLDETEKFLYDLVANYDYEDDPHCRTQKAEDFLMRLQELRNS